LTRVTGTLHEDVCTFMTIPRGILLRMRDVSDKTVEKINTHTHTHTHCRFNSFFLPHIPLLMW